MRIVQITDTHVPAAPGDQTVLEMLCDIELLDPVETLRHSLADIARLEPVPELIVATGDLGDRGHRASYQRLNIMLNELGVPVLCIPGNHDLPDAFDDALPGGCVELGDVHDVDDWTFAFARSGNTEWGELGAHQVERLDAALATRTNENVFLWLHHPPVPLMHGYLPESGFLEADVAALVERHPITGIAAGHVHSEHALQFRGIPLYATPSTYMGAPGPGYRIFDFTPTGYTTEVRAFPDLTAMTDAKLAKLRLAMAGRIAAMRDRVPQRGDEERARAEVLEWQHEADQRRGHPASIA